MTVHAHNIPKAAAACTLTILAVFLTARGILDSTASPASLILVTRTTEACASGKPEAGSAAGSPAPFDPSLHYARLEVTEGKQYEGTGRNIFSAYVEPPAARLPQRRSGPPPPVPLLPRPAIRLTFFGFAITKTHPKKIFFSQDGDLFVGTEGEIIDRRYKIVRINKESVDLEDLLDNTIQTLALREG